jgi:hypothetical protein
VNEEQNSSLLSDFDHDAVTLVDAMESRRGSFEPTSRTESKSSMPNGASLALARLVYRELVNDCRDNSLAFLTTEDAEFVNTAARAAKGASEVGAPFSIEYRDKKIQYIPSHWMELISVEIKRLVSSEVQCNV